MHCLVKLTQLVPIKHKLMRLRSLFIIIMADNQDISRIRRVTNLPTTTDTPQQLIDRVKLLTHTVLANQ